MQTLTGAALHSVPVGRPLWNEQLAFRDDLRTHPDVALEYAALQRRLPKPTDLIGRRIRPRKHHLCGACSGKHCGSDSPSLTAPVRPIPTTAATASPPTFITAARSRRRMAGGWAPAGDAASKRQDAKAAEQHATRQCGSCFLLDWRVQREAYPRWRGWLDLRGSFREAGTARSLRRPRQTV